MYELTLVACIPWESVRSELNAWAEPALAVLGLLTLFGALLAWRERRRTEVIARVCPFQHITYIVRLCANFGGVWRPIESGHLYDLEAKRAERLAAAIRIQIPGAPAR